MRHLVYVSVAHPAPVMREYIAARTEAEEAIREAGLNATILRPWYVLGPGRRWPLAIAPIYWLLEALPSTRESARRLGLVSVEQMIGSIVRAIVEPPQQACGMGSAARSGSRNREHGEQFFLGQDADAQFPRFVELGAGILAGHHVAGLLAHGAGDFAAGLLDQLLGLVAAQGGQGAGEDEGLAL